MGSFRSLTHVLIQVFDERGNTTTTIKHMVFYYCTFSKERKNIHKRLTGFCYKFKLVVPAQYVFLRWTIRRALLLQKIPGVLTRKQIYVSASVIFSNV